MVYELKDKVVLITGAASGIGAAATRLLLEEGVKHISVLDVTEDSGIKLQDDLNSKYGKNKVKFYNVDVTNDEQLFDVFSTTIKIEGNIDIVINNAAIMNDKMYKKEIEVNVSAVVTSTLKALELMRMDKGGKGGLIVNISSVTALAYSPLTPVYFGTKSAVLHFSNCIGLNEYYSRTKVRVAAVCFGATDTPLLTKENLGSFDEEIEAAIMDYVKPFPLQSVESAAKGLVEVCKKAESGSTWLVHKNEPPRDITQTLKKVFGTLSELVFS